MRLFEKRLSRALLVVLAGSLFGETVSTRSAIERFFALSQNDFEIDSKSKNADEQKAYSSYKKADRDGKDGRVTYGEYLSHVNDITPGFIANYDFALAKILPSLKDFHFVDEAAFLASGTIGGPLAIDGDFVIPGGSKITLFKNSGFRVNAANDFAIHGISVRSGADTPVDVYYDDEKGYYPGKIQLLKDTLIDGVPCRGGHVDIWDVNVSLSATGKVLCAVLSGDYTSDGISFGKDEKIQRDDQGRIVAAVIFRNRAIQDHPVIAVRHAGNNSRETGLWGGQTPNVFFENGLISMCYESNKILHDVVIPNTHAYFYSATGEVVGILPWTPYLWGFPVAPRAMKQNWDWDVPLPTVNISGGQATFAIDVSVQISSGSKKAVLPEGSIVTLDIASGSCRAVKMPNGEALTYDVKDRMRPALIPADRQTAQSLRWVDQWLAAHPGEKDGNREAYIIHTSMKERLIAEKIAEEKALSVRRMLDTVLLYKNKANGLAPGNIAMDQNGDGTIQDTELAPSSLLAPGDAEFPIESLLGYFVDSVARKIPVSRLRSVGVAMESVPLADWTESLGVLDSLGSILSAAGIHPFASRNIYYFPNGSGDKAPCLSVDFYPAGTIKSLIADSAQFADRALTISIPDSAAKMQFWLYNPDRVKGENWASGYYEKMNGVYFYEDGKLLGVGVIPYAEFEIPGKLGCVQRKSQIHGIRWHPDGEVYTILFDSEIRTTWNLPGNNTAQNPVEIEWWRGDPRFAIKVALNGVGIFKAKFPKGTTAFYRFGKDGAIESFTRNYKNDTELDVYAGFFLSRDGKVTDYW